MRPGPLAWLGLLGALAACSGPEPVPTYLVERRAFLHRVTAEGTLKAAKTTPVTVPDEVRRTVRLAWLAPDGGRVEAGDLVASFDPTEMEERLEEGRTELASAGFEVDRKKAESGARAASIGTQLEAADLELNHARQFVKSDDAVFSRNEILESEIDEELAAERKEHATDSLRTEESKSKTELDLLAIQERKALLTIDRARDGLSALEVRSPHAGILTLKRNWRGEVVQVGAEMWRGQDIAEIPDLSVMEAEVFVLEADAGGLEIGKPAMLVIESAPERSYPAKIRRVEPVAKPRFRGSPVQYFGVTLELVGEPTDGMKPGQRVRATLHLDEADDVLIVPRQALVTEDGETRVFVENGSGFEPRRVETGASSLGLVVVTAGLDEGERVALSPPGLGSLGGGDGESAARLPVGAS